MSEVRVVRRMDCPADVVWALIGDFGGLQRWHPRVQQLDLSWEGRIRSLQFDDGGHAVERLDARNDPARRYAYIVVDSSLPVQHCHGVLRVNEIDGGAACDVVWSARFEAVGNNEATAIAALEAFYADGVEALARTLEDVDDA